LRVDGARRHGRARRGGALRPPLGSGGVSAVTVEDRRSILQRRPGAGARKVRNSVATLLIGGSFVVALLPIVAVVVYVFQRGSDQLNWAFLTDPIPISDRIIGPGMGPAVAGTLLMTGAAAALSIPLGILGGIYINEYGGRGIVARLVRFLAEVMTGVP